jgi:stress response protein YsnF
MLMPDFDLQPSLTETTTERSTAPAAMPIIEESLIVGKRTVDRGGYRIVKTVNVREEWVDEPLISQTQHVERRPIGRLLPTMEPPAARQEGDTLIISIVEEVLVTEKRLMLKEELHIRQVNSVVRNPTKHSLRSEEVIVTQLQLDPGVLPNPSIS